MRNATISIISALILSGCIQTQELPLAQNVSRLETTGVGASAASRTGQATLQKAAEITLARGYTHFVLTNADLASGVRVVSIWDDDPIYARTSRAGVTVVMYTAGNRPGNAFDARKIGGGTQSPTRASGAQRNRQSAKPINSQASNGRRCPMGTEIVTGVVCEQQW